MRSTQHNLANAREELVQVKQEFTRLQKRIEAVRDTVADSLVRLFGDGRIGAARACIADKHICTACRLIKEDFE